jgi:hypothetical protein
MPFEGGEGWFAGNVSSSEGPKPCRFRGIGALREGGAKAGKVPPDMIENAIKHDMQTAPSSLRDQPVEISFIAEARIDPEVVNGVIAMCRRYADRPEQQARCSESDSMVQPVDNVIEPVTNLIARDHGAFCPNKAQRINMPEQGVVDPVARALRHSVASVSWNASFSMA